MALVHQMLLLLGVMVAIHTKVEADILAGVCHSTLADNLPSPWEVNDLYRRYHIRRAMFYDYDSDVIQAFRGSGLEISFGLSNGDLMDMATSQELVDQWFNNNVKPYISDFVINYIVIGDKAIPDLADVILPVMQFLRNTLNANNAGQIKITTLIGYRSALITPDPPSCAEFDPNPISSIKPILEFLSSIYSPVMVSVFPYLKFREGQNLSMSYANFQSCGVVVDDEEFKYYNMFDAMIDAFYVAMMKLEITSVDVVVGETGWPACGDDENTTPEMAGIYNRNFVKHIQSGKGTPRNPNVFIEGYIQSMFNENLRPEGISQCFEIFKPTCYLCILSFDYGLDIGLAVSSFLFVFHR